MPRVVPATFLHVMIVVIVVMIVVMVVMVVIVMVMVLLGERRERSETKCGAEC
jgi:hypothetical protein